LQSEHKSSTSSVEVIEAQVTRLDASPATARRRWSVAAKERIVAAASEPGANVSAIARTHGLSPQQVFTWRRRADYPPANHHAQELTLRWIGWGLSDKAISADAHRRRRHRHACDGRVATAHELSDQKDGRDGGGRGSGASVIIVPPQHGQRSKAIPAFS